mgnify:CR=1 FL=1
MTADEARKLREKHLAKQTIEPFVAQLHDRIAAAAAKGESSTELAFRNRSPGPTALQLDKIRARLRADGFRIDKRYEGPADGHVEIICW